jgi:hypothetical protein
LPERAAVDAAIAKFQQSLGKPRQHSGLGVRPFGRYLEFRTGLHLRILTIAEGGDWFLVCVGDHDEVRAYIKNNAS